MNRDIDLSQKQGIPANSELLIDNPHFLRLSPQNPDDSWSVDNNFNTKEILQNGNHHVLVNRRDVMMGMDQNRISISDDSHSFATAPHQDKLSSNESIEKTKRRIRTKKVIDKDFIESDKINDNLLNNNPNEILKIPRIYAKQESTSKYYGVCWVPKRNRWRSRVRLPNRKREHIGYYKNEEEAARAYDMRYFQIYKRRDGLNFPQEYFSTTTSSSLSLPKQDEQNNIIINNCNGGMLIMSARSSELDNDGSVTSSLQVTPLLGELLLSPEASSMSNTGDAITNDINLGPPRSEIPPNFRSSDNWTVVQPSTFAAITNLGVPRRVTQGNSSRETNRQLQELEFQTLQQRNRHYSLMSPGLGTPMHHRSIVDTSPYPMMQTLSLHRASSNNFNQTYFAGLLGPISNPPTPLLPPLQQQVGYDQFDQRLWYQQLQLQQHFVGPKKDQHHKE